MQWWEVLSVEFTNTLDVSFLLPQCRSLLGLSVGSKDHLTLAPWLSSFYCFIFLCFNLKKKSYSWDRVVLVEVRGNLVSQFSPSAFTWILQDPNQVTRLVRQAPLPAKHCLIFMYTLFWHVE